MSILPSLSPCAYEMHILVGIVIRLLSRRHWLLIALVAAIAKELFDLWWHGKPDVLDIVFTIIGSFLPQLFKK